MSRYQHSKSGLFLMELLFNLLLFCVLCGCGLMLFIKSNSLTEDTTSLHHAVSISSSVASLYEAGDGSLSAIYGEFPYADVSEDSIDIYYDGQYEPCDKAQAVYTVTVTTLQATIDKVDISFYGKDGELLHQITACHYTPSTVDTVKEVTLP